MNSIENSFFSLLTKDRRESSTLLQKPSTRGIMKSVVEKYSDQAHFIYELLQNADDAKASYARFVLFKDKLVFAHNGSRHFSISNPKTEDIDSSKGILGDINAITSIANSNKSTEATIGKFGVGFKAVFQYTAHPEIYDPKFSFRISNFIVPELIREGHNDRKQDETLFVFPFDNPNKSIKESYEDIEEKLKRLKHPVLFLTNLRKVFVTIGNQTGLYEKIVEQNILYKDDNTNAELLTLNKKIGNNTNNEKLWLFSRITEDFKKYSVGFFIDENGHLKSVKEPAFCFFSTKETTGLNFLVHAPFLLTDSREAIQAGNTHNKKMIDLLAKLAAKSIFYMTKITDTKGSRLVDDRIIDIIPFDSSIFTEIDDRDKISFKPFYNEILECFKKSPIIPTKESYTTSSNAFWASTIKITQVFNDDMLRELSSNKEACWVFPSLGRNSLYDKNRALCYYIDSITYARIDEEDIIEGKKVTISNSKVQILSGLTAEFIEHQQFEWLKKLYYWINETENRTELAKNKPVFINQKGKAVLGFDDYDEPIIFFPNEGCIWCNVINDFFMQDEKIVKFFKKLGINKASLYDEVYNAIIPSIKNGQVTDWKYVFKVLYSYYKQCSHSSVSRYIDDICDLKFILCRKIDDETTYVAEAKDIFFSSDSIIYYFKKTKSDVYIIDNDYLLEILGKEEKKDLNSFLCELGVHDSINEIITISVDGSEVIKYYKDSFYFSVDRRWEEKTLPGLNRALELITDTQDLDLSQFVWEMVINTIRDEYQDEWDINNIFIGTFYFRPDWRYSPRYKEYESKTQIYLRSKKWLLSNNNEFVAPEEITLSEINTIYDYNSSISQGINLLLHFKTEEENEATSNENYDDLDLTEEQLDDIKFGKAARELGITMEDLYRLSKQKEIDQSIVEENLSDDKKSALPNNNIQNNSIESESNNIIPEDDNKDKIIDFPKKSFSTNKSKNKVISDIIEKTKEQPGFYYEKNDEKEVEFDDLIRPSVNYSSRIESAKQRSAREIDQIAYMELLQNKALNSKKYSYCWFKTLLEMEAICSKTDSYGNDEFSISFSKVEKEQGTERTLILKHPNRYIPQSIEDLADIPLSLYSEKNQVNVVIEVVNIKSYTLRVKLKSKHELEKINLNEITEARIDVKKPSFLIEELRKQFNLLNLKDEFDMQANLCKNIEFIFGPPGTGKTTYLAKNILIPLMNQTPSRVLVLTPTNKSSDVLVQRIINSIEIEQSYKDWLVRFGTTCDEHIEKKLIHKDKTLDIRTLKRSVTVTTIARFAYDYFMPNNERLYLREINWDYIVIDEASMIPIASIIYPLFKKRPVKFIIAGDPFQIQPITSVEQWKDENIYTITNLVSFKNPSMKPHKYKVISLTTQYRSVPAVGRIYSEFAYDCILKHSRSRDTQKSLNINDVINLHSLNIIKFPISKYESINKAKKLNGSSPYHIYSALFTFEFIAFLAELLFKRNPNKVFSIGIIAPYRAQADLIEKLSSQHQYPNSISIQVGTIHGFQGDECDIIIGVFNPPPIISSSTEQFLNKKNIINVAVSRARDYLILLVPDNNTENVEKLTCINKVEKIMKSLGDNIYKEFSSKEIENIMFGQEEYIEENTFSTGHQNVNVYGLPEKKYEVRSENGAIDIQVHSQIKKLIEESEKQNEVQNSNISRPIVKVDKIVTTTKRRVVVIKNNQNLSNEYITFGWIHNKTKKCPYDDNELKSVLVPVKRNDGVEKKIYMTFCSHCGRYYIKEGALPKTFHIKDYKLKER